MGAKRKRAVIEDSDDEETQQDIIASTQPTTRKEVRRSTRNKSVPTPSTKSKEPPAKKKKIEEPKPKEDDDSDSELEEDDGEDEPQEVREEVSKTNLDLNQRATASMICQMKAPVMNFHEPTVATRVRDIDETHEKMLFASFTAFSRALSTSW